MDESPSLFCLRGRRATQDPGPPKWERRGLSFSGDCGILSVRVLPINGKRCNPPVSLGGYFLTPRSLKKGGLTMITYSDLIQTGILVVAIISLFIQANKK